MGTTTRIVLREPLETRLLVMTADEANLQHRRAKNLRGDLTRKATAQSASLREIVSASELAAVLLRDIREVAEQPRTEFEIVDQYDGMVSGQTSVVVDGDRVGLRDAAIVEAMEYLPRGEDDSVWMEWLVNSFTHHAEPLTYRLCDYRIGSDNLISIKQEQFRPA